MEHNTMNETLVSKKFYNKRLSEEEDMMQILTREKL
jgi:hypothetical protein